MDEKTKKILDELCQDKMNIKDAMKELDMSKEEIWELLDNYEYQTTMEETIEAFEILREVRESMKKIDYN
jgi:septation ring formation regulator EzrA